MPSALRQPLYRAMRLLNSIAPNDERVWEFCKDNCKHDLTYRVGGVNKCCDCWLDLTLPVAPEDSVIKGTLRDAIAAAMKAGE